MISTTRDRAVTRSWRVTPATEEHVPFITLCIRHLARFNDDPVPTAAGSENAAREFIREVAFVARNEEDELAGVALVGGRVICECCGQRCLDVSIVYVEPWAKGQGCMSALLREVEQAARRLPGVKGLRLMVRPDNLEGIASFRRVGFTRLGYEVMEKVFDRETP